MLNINKIINDCITEKDCQTYDVVRILGTISFLFLNIIAFIHIIMNCHNFDFIEISSGMAIMLGVIAAGVTFKYTKE